MKYKKVFDEAISLNSTVFDFNFTVSKLKEDNTTVTKTYSINIPNSYAWQYCGERKVNEWVKKIYKNDATTSAEKLTQFKQTLTPVIESNKFKWAALLDSMTLYFNPLWNVDGTEVTENDIAERVRTENLGAREDSNTLGETERTDTHGAQEESTAYGNGSSYQDQTQYGTQTRNITKGQEVDQMQYGQDQTTDVYGARGKNSIHKTNPFNDTDHLYDTDKTIEGEDSATDTHTRALHNDQTTYGQRNDSDTRQSYTDTTTHGAHTDKVNKNQYIDKVEEAERVNTTNIGAQENVTTDDAYLDTITVRRFGNIGVTKSTDLLESYRQMCIDMYPIILDDIMKMVSRGY